jgi:hypothetical protein
MAEKLSHPLLGPRVVYQRKADFDLQEHAAELVGRFKEIANQQHNPRSLLAKLRAYERQAITMLATTFGSPMGWTILEILHELAIARQEPADEATDAADLERVWGMVVQKFSETFSHLIRHDWQSVLMADLSTLPAVQELAELDANVMKAVAQHLKNKGAVGGWDAYIRALKSSAPPSVEKEKRKGTRHQTDAKRKIVSAVKKEMVQKFIREERFCGTLEQLRLALKSKLGDQTPSIATLHRYDATELMSQYQGNPRRAARKTGRGDPTKDAKYRNALDTEAYTMPEDYPEDRDV